MVSKAALLLLAFCLGMVILKNSQIVPKCHISHYLCYNNNNLYVLEGFVDSQVELKNKRQTFVFKVSKIQTGKTGNSCCGKILVFLKGHSDMHYGEELILRGYLRHPYAFNGNEKHSYRDYLYNQGIYSIMYLRSKSDIVRLNKNCGSAVKRLAFYLKDKIEDIIFKHVPGLSASILEAMVLGEKKHIPSLIYKSMVKSGTVHILVVSGFNVGIVTFAIILFLKLLRLPRRMRIYIAIPLLILYCFLTGASNPVVRATIMAIIFLLAYLIKRQPDIYNSLGLAALFILLINPKQLFDIGFQLSFISVISIVYLYPKIRLLLRLDSLKIRYLRFVIDSCLVSFSAWIGTAGFIAYYFKIFSPVTVLANLFIVPIAAFITLCGFSLILVDLILPPLTIFIGLSCELAVLLLLKINAFLIKLPAAYSYLP